MFSSRCSLKCEKNARASPWTREYGWTCKGCVRGCKFVMFHASSISVRWKCRGWRRGEEDRKASAPGPAAAPWFLDADAPARSGQRQRKEKNRPCDKHPASPEPAPKGHRIPSVGLLMASLAPAQAALAGAPAPLGFRGRSPWRFFHGSTAILKVNCPKGKRNRSGPFRGKNRG